MSFASFLMLGIGLSMDAFAVAVCKGLHMRKINLCHALTIALFFGSFQALMPLLGWFLGRQFERYITAVDHWVAFALLAAIGGKMIIDALKDNGDDDCDCDESLDIRELFMLAIATSIDALAVGITLAFLEANIWLAIAVIGITTFVFSIGGVVIGNRFGAKYKNRAALVGGVILILIGLKILLEHLGILTLPF